MQGLGRKLYYWKKSLGRGPSGHPPKVVGVNYGIEGKGREERRGKGQLLANYCTSVRPVLVGGGGAVLLE